VCVCVCAGVGVGVGVGVCVSECVCVCVRERVCVKCLFLGGGGASRRWGMNGECRIVSFYRYEERRAEWTHQTSATPSFSPRL